MNNGRRFSKSDVGCALVVERLQGSAPLCSFIVTLPPPPKGTTFLAQPRAALAKLYRKVWRAKIASPFADAFLGSISYVYRVSVDEAVDTGKLSRKRATEFYLLTICFQRDRKITSNLCLFLCLEMKSESNWQIVTFNCLSGSKK